MVEKRQPIQIDEAINKVMQHPLSPKEESVPLLESVGRSLAVNLYATHSVPPFNRSPYDGFAIKSEDTVHASRNLPVFLKVVGEIGAGFVFNRTVRNGEAVRIMTGAKILMAVMQLSCWKSVREHGSEQIELVRSIKANDNISFKGEDTKEGALISKAGTSIHPGIIAQLATFGYSEVPFFGSRELGYLATGSELLDVHQKLEPGKIRNSNAYMVAAQVMRAGAVPIVYGKLPDDLEACLAMITDQMDDVDVMITTGGASVGDYDLVPEFINRLHAKTLFNKVAMRPGSVTTAANLNGKMLFGLSGNPGACYVGFELFVKPLIRKALGTEQIHHAKSKGVLGADFLKPNPFTRIIRGRLEEENGQHVLFPSGLDKSGSVISLAEAEVFIILPAGTRGFERGMEVDFLLLEDQKGSEETWKTFSKL
ncbi:LOW QUALITY PROTEIN: molybdopterin biosynthesis protein MoeA [Bacillus sp. JCM 19045]|nr:LOW QUALITY PROTEIN: molybdopterin biosynthesis protein MoeA [Bacillus sp. JCM 19045]